MFGLKQGSYKKLQQFFKSFQGLFKDTEDFQRLPTRNIISQTVQKCNFPVYKTLRLELFASPTSLHFSVHLS